MLETLDAPSSLDTFLEQGLITDIVGVLKSGKEATMKPAGQRATPNPLKKRTEKK